VKYDIGQGVPQDYAKALKWYRLAAGQGAAKAQFNLGFMYELGAGVPQDYGEAVKWYRRAAAQGLAVAQDELGVMYANGAGVPKDYVQAYMWYTLAASRATAERQKDVAKARDELAAKMTPAQIVEATRLAQEWKPATQAE